MVLVILVVSRVQELAQVRMYQPSSRRLQRRESVRCLLGFGLGGQESDAEAWSDSDRVRVLDPSWVVVVASCSLVLVFLLCVFPD